MPGRERRSSFIKLQVAMDNIIDASMEELSPDPFVSCFVDDCVGRGRTIKQGGAVYDFCGPLICGVANVGDSLEAIRKLVFEEKRLTGAQLLHALDTNFEDRATKPTGEEIQKMLLAAPKYGNDDEHADTLAAGALDLFCRRAPEVQDHEVRAGAQRGHLARLLQHRVGEHPLRDEHRGDARRAKGGDADGGHDLPDAGRGQKGAARRDEERGKIPNLLCSGGNLFNMKFSPLVLQDDAGRRKFSSLIRTFLGDLKGMHVQFNIVDGSTLKEAKRQPEKYPDLMVRVAGYSALFTSLDPKLQDDIINRTEQVTL